MGRYCGKRRLTSAEKMGFLFEFGNRLRKYMHEFHHVSGNGVYRSIDLHVWELDLLGCSSYQEKWRKILGYDEMIRV